MSLAAAAQLPSTGITELHYTHLYYPTEAGKTNATVSSTKSVHQFNFPERNFQETISKPVLPKHIQRMTAQCLTSNAGHFV